MTGAIRRLAVDIGPLRESPAFRRLWIGQSIAYVAWRMMLVLVPVQVYRLTGSTLDVGLVALVQFVPLVVFTILGGALADTRDRRAILWGSTIGIAAVTAAFVVVSASGNATVALVFVLGFLAWSSFSLGAGAIRSITPRLVPLDQLPAAAALNGLYNNLGLVLGPAIAGVLISEIGFAGTYGVSLGGIVLSLVSVLGLPRIPPDANAPRMSLATIADGFRYLRTQHLVLAFFLVDTFAMLFGMPNALFPALAQHVFRDSRSVGFLFAAPAVGAFAISLVSGWASRVGRQGVAIVVSVSTWGITIAAFGLTHMLWLALLLLGIAGAADQVSAIFRSTIVLTVTPDHMRGRLGGIEFAQIASTPSLGNVEAGVVAQLTSLRFSIVSGGLACIASTIALAAMFPVLLRYDARARA
ncbi:MAG: MFS transporter [Actinobacteria bacterium]|nr:MFS transporter [Actinomycetota bacterium]MBV8479224.1 MFS transporter [Actinomycetota bacterium]